MVGRSSVAPKVFDAAYGPPVRRFWSLPRTGGAPWEIDLPAVPERFDTIIDSGLFHVLSAGDGRRMIGGAHTLLRPGGTYHLLCFSERKRRPAPHRLSEKAVLRNFGPGWRVESVVESRYHVLDGTIGPNAWLGRFTRV